MTKEEETKKSTQYDWEGLIRKIRKIRGDHDRDIKSQRQIRPLVIKEKEYLENAKTIARGLMRWECVRRNAQLRRLYREDNDILCLGGDICLTPETTKYEISKDIAKINTRVNKDKSVTFLDRKSARKYTAYYSFMSDLSHSPFLNNLAVHSKQMHAMVYEIVDKRDVAKYDRDVVEKFISEIPTKVDFIIDFGYSKQEIMAAFEKQIDMWYRLHGAIGERNNKRALDYTNIERYLEVYDLKNGKSKPTFFELAQKFYPGPSSKNLDSAIQQVKREYKRAKELINGGFLSIK